MEDLTIEDPKTTKIHIVEEQVKRSELAKLSNGKYKKFKKSSVVVDIVLGIAHKLENASKSIGLTSMELAKSKQKILVETAIDLKQR